MNQRPQNFRLDYGASLGRGLVFAGLGGHAGSTYFYDDSPYGNNGTLIDMDPPTDWVWAPELGRWALTFAAGGQYVDGGNPSPACVASPIVAVSCWCKTVDYTDSYNGGIGRGRVMDNGAGVSWQWYCHEGNCKFWVSDDTNTLHGAGNVAIIDNNWHHWLGLFSGTRISLWKDGTEAAGADWTGAIDYTKTYNYFRIGWGLDGATKCLNGQLADVLVYNRIPSAAEIARLADPSNVMLDGLIQAPHRRVFKAAAAPGGLSIPIAMHHYQQLQGAN